MSEDKQERSKKKVVANSIILTKDDVAVLYNLLHSGGTISIKLAGNVTTLQAWVKEMAHEHGIVITKTKEGR